MQPTFAYSWLLWSLAVLPVLSLLAGWARYRRQRDLLRLGLRIGWRARQGGWLLRAVHGLCLALGLTALALGMAGPQWGLDWTQASVPGRDLVVVLDLSGSMRAEQPSGSERARNALYRLLTTLEQRGGQRLALIVFAARPKLACPLTHDLTHIKEVLDGLDLTRPDPELQPTTGDRSGTRIGAALKLAVQTCDPRYLGASDILLLSDGDDPRDDGEWRAGVQAARAEGVPVHVVGIRGGAEDNKKSRTRLVEGVLRQIATITSGSLTLADTRSLALGERYRELVAGRPGRDGETDAFPTPQPRYPLFLLPAFGFLALALLIPEGPARRL